MVESKERSRRDSMGGPSQLMRALRTGVVDGGEPGPDWERRKVKSELSLGCDTVRMCVCVCQAVEPWMWHSRFEQHPALHSSTSSPQLVICTVHSCA